jgi:hypothetical protein
MAASQSFFPCETSVLAHCLHASSYPAKLAALLLKAKEADPASSIRITQWNDTTLWLGALFGNHDSIFACWRSFDSNEKATWTSRVEVGLNIQLSPILDKSISFMQLKL